MEVRYPSPRDNGRHGRPIDDAKVPDSVELCQEKCICGGLHNADSLISAYKHR